MIKRFIYTKDNGDVSERTLFVLGQPSNLLFGLDVSNSTQDEIDALEALKEKHRQETTKLVESLELSKNFRRFKENNIEYMD